MVKQQRFFIGYDDSGHEYLVPADKENSWFSWLGLLDDHEDKWEVPKYAKLINGHLTFADPQVG